MSGCCSICSHRALVAQDEGSGAELAIVTDRAQGGGSLGSGQAELMVHRRTLLDDQRGVGEPINETMCGCSACACAGLIARGTHYLTLQVTPGFPHACGDSTAIALRLSTPPSVYNWAHLAPLASTSMPRSCACTATDNAAGFSMCTS